MTARWRSLSEADLKVEIRKAVFGCKTEEQVRTALATKLGYEHNAPSVAVSKPSSWGQVMIMVMVFAGNGEIVSC